MHAWSDGFSEDLTHLSKNLQFSTWPCSAVASAIRQHVSVQAALNLACRRGNVPLVRHMLSATRPQAVSHEQSAFTLLIAPARARDVRAVQGSPTKGSGVSSDDDWELRTPGACHRAHGLVPQPCCAASALGRSNPPLWHHVASVPADACVQVANWGRSGSALWYAAKHGHVEVCRLLLSQKDNPSRADCFGSTALQAAAQGGHVEVDNKTTQATLPCPTRTESQNSTAALVYRSCASCRVLKAAPRPTVVCVLSCAGL